MYNIRSIVCAAFKIGSEWWSIIKFHWVCYEVCQNTQSISTLSLSLVFFSKFDTHSHKMYLLQFNAIVPKGTLQMIKHKKNPDQSSNTHLSLNFRLHLQHILNLVDVRYNTYSILNIDTVVTCTEVQTFADACKKITAEKKNVKRNGRNRKNTHTHMVVLVQIQSSER